MASNKDGVIEEKASVFLVNIRGLTSHKWSEWPAMIGKVNSSMRISMLTETQHKIEKVFLGEHYNYEVSMRSQQDKKGGGLLVGSGDEVSIMKVESGNPDVLCVDMEMRSKRIRVILTYWDVTNNDRNDKIIDCIKRIVEDHEGKLMVLGDMNAHIGILGKQEMNKNGEKLLMLVEECRLVILNLDEACKGETTREENGHKSAIDFVLVNEPLYGDFVEMDIDEHKNFFDLSDHCTIRIDFRIGMKGKNERLQRNIEYYRIKDDMKEKFLNKLEGKLRKMEEAEQKLVFHEVVKEACEEVLKRTRIERRMKLNEWENVWMNDEIRREIGVRKRLNRERRNSEGFKRDEKWVQYREQKRKVADMVRMSIREYEKNITDEIKSSRDSGKKMWHNISLLRGAKKKCKTRVYDDIGNEINADELKNHVSNFWKNVYQMHENDVKEIWNDTTRKLYIRDQYRDEDRVNVVYENVLEYGRGVFRLINFNRNIPTDLVEHYSMTRGRVEDIIRRRMDGIVVNKEEVKKAVRRMKSGKQPGIDGIKAEVYKWMLESEVCVNAMCKYYNDVLEKGEPVKEWSVSKTCMIPKVNKPKVKDLRPIALLNVEYKIFMRMMKEKLIEHLKGNGLVNDLQIGFTSGRRTEDNIFMLNYVIESCRREKKELIAVFVDFAKAFDSIRRGSLVECMMKCKCDPRMIDVFAGVYEEDSTEFSINGENMGIMKVKNGIRQGCTCSPQLFIMAANEISSGLQRSGLGFRNEQVYVPALFFADDGVIFGNSVSEVEKMVDVFVEKAAGIGMSVNKGKCYVLRFNKKEEVENIRGMDIVEEVKYLGVTVSNKKDVFKVHREKVIIKARRMTNMTYAVIHKSCNRVLIGKTYWKNVVMPGLLYGSSVFCWNVSELDRLQKCENAVWRCVLGAPSYAPLVTLQGEVGSSSMKARDIKVKLNYEKHVRKGENELLRRMYDDMTEWNRCKWISTVKTYREMVGVPAMELDNLSNDGIKRKVYAWENDKWNEERIQKSTISLYNECKSEIRDESLYENDWGSVLLFRCRSNSLRLKWRERYVNGNVNCVACKLNVEETLEHFLCECEWYDCIRREFGMNGVSVRNQLFGAGLGWARECRRYLEGMWQRRKLKVD